jgi:hypothetical protein
VTRTGIILTSRFIGSPQGADISSRRLATLRDAPLGQPPPVFRAQSAAAGPRPSDAGLAVANGSDSWALRDCKSLRSLQSSVPQAAAYRLLTARARRPSCWSASEMCLFTVIIMLCALPVRASKIV